MKKTAIIIGAMLIYKLARPIRAYAWKSQTHEEITAQALKLFSDLNKTKLTNFYSKYSSKIIEGAQSPDLDGDVDKGSGTHYYSPTNPKGKPLPQKGDYYQNRVGAYSKSARTMFEENYTSALNLYKNGKIEQAMYTLGRAAHFVEDISCPVHTANVKFFDKETNLHRAFERYSINEAKKHLPTTYDKRLTKTYSEKNFANAINKLAQKSNKRAKPMEKLETSAYDETLAEMIPAAVQNVMALFMRFYDDCAGNNSNYLCNEKAYSIRNEETGQLMTITAKGLSLEKLDHSKEQKLIFEMSDDGTFALKTSDGRYLKNDGKKLEKPSDASKPAQFRFAAYGDNRYRITTEDSSYCKVLTASRNAVTAADFAPDSKACSWIIVG